MQKIPTALVRDPDDRAHVIWAPMVGFPDYEVSDQGKVRRITPGRGTRSGYVLKHQLTEDGYQRVGLRVNGRRRTAPVHRAVALTFIGPPPSDLHQVNHKNGVKTDNSVENLEWATSAENAQHAAVNGLRASKRGCRNGRAKVSERQCMEIRDLLTHGRAYSEICEWYGIGKSQVWNIKSGRQWKEAAA